MCGPEPKPVIFLWGDGRWERADVINEKPGMVFVARQGSFTLTESPMGVGRNPTDENGLADHATQKGA